jgi:hypothetical protein
VEKMERFIPIKPNTSSSDIGSPKSFYSVIAPKRPLNLTAAGSVCK